MNRRSNKNYLIFIFLIFIFRILLEVSYNTVVSKFYYYAGFKINFSLANYSFSWVIYFINALILKDRLYKASDYFFITAVLAVTAPVCVLYGYDYQRSIYPVLVTVITFIFIYFITNTKLISFKKLPTIEYGMNLVVIFSFIFVSSLVVWYYISGVTFNFNLKKVYEFRADNYEISAFGILGYTNNWTYKVFNMVLFSLALLKKRYLLAILFFILQIYFFGASANKGVLFTPLLIFIIWYYFRKTNSLAVVPFIFASVIALTIIIYYTFDSILFTSYFSRRVFFVPAHLLFTYFDYFSEFPHIYWSNSVLSTFSTYPYDASVAKVIGRYLGSDDMAANNGFVSTGYAHADLFGVFIYAIIIGLILRFIDDITNDLLPVWLTVALTVVPFRKLIISSDLLTTLLTHGFIVTIVIVFFIRSKKYA